MNKIWILMAIVIAGCAHGKMGNVEQDLSAGSVGKEQMIYVAPVSVADAKFSGDKSADTQRVSEEKTEIEQRYNREIVEELKKKGFKASSTSQKGALTLKGDVSRFEHGSAAARILVGMGSGSSNLFTDFQLTDSSQKVLAKFEVIATSGGNGGLQAAGGYLRAHIKDGAQKVAEYMAKANGFEKK